MRLRFPQPPGHDGFLSEYWQRLPLLMPAALRNVENLIDADALFELASRDDVESRLVQCDAAQRQWDVTPGPFLSRDFAELPASGWTLLVQDVDRFVPEIAELLSAFSFLPAWRFEDVMVSYAAPGGTVGPHVDQYDAFLIQGSGTRNWHTGSSDLRQLADQPLQVLQQFDSQQCHTLTTGDVLYMPPGLAHYGIADQACMTLSVGFRAPSGNELLLAHTEQLTALGGSRYSDSDLASTEVADGLISTQALERVRDILNRQWQSDPGLIAKWFGQLVTEGKPWLSAAEPDNALSADIFRARLQVAPLQLHPLCRVARTDLPGSQYLFVDGERYDYDDSARSLVEAICQHQPVTFGRSPLAQALAYRLYCRGKLYWPE